MPSDAVPSVPETELDEIGTELQTLEQLLGELRDRYQQIKTDEPLRTQLRSQLASQQQALQEIRDRAKTERMNGDRGVATSPSQAELKAELAKLSNQLDEVEMRLESRLVSWLGLREYFWQIVRFGGLGILIGWGLATWSMGSRILPSNPERPEVNLEKSK